MSISDFCLTQRQQEAEQLKKLLSLSLVGSALLHGVFVGTLMVLPQNSYLAEEPIELILLEEPEPEIPKPDPKPVVDIFSIHQK